MADDDNKTCKHTICTCKRADDSDYCSAYCETAGGSVELGCNCGHKGCATDLR